MNIKNRLDLSLFAIMVLILTMVTGSSAIAGETRTLEANETTISELVNSNDPEEWAAFVELNKQNGGQEITDPNMIRAGEPLYFPDENELETIAWEMKNSDMSAAEAITTPISEDNPNFIGPRRPPEEPEDTPDPEVPEDTEPADDEEDDEEEPVSTVSDVPETIDLLEISAVDAKGDEDHKDGLVGVVDGGKVLKDAMPSVADSRAMPVEEVEVGSANEPGWYERIMGLLN